MPINLQGSSVKLMCSDHKIAKLYCENNVIYSSGNIVTYHVDAGVTYQEEVDEGASCLSPKTFAPAKSGWEFVGWRQNAVASDSVLSSKLMGDDPITLYAVFRQSVTVTYYNNSTTASSASGYRYYNNGTVKNPSFTLSQAARSGWTARGWSTGTAGNSGITYNNATAFTRDSNVTLYGLYQQTITLTYYNNSTTAATTSGTRYYNSNGNVVDPSFILTQASRSGWTARGWSTSTAGNGGIAYNNGLGFFLSSNITLYGMYYQNITLTYYNGSTTAASTSGTRYYNSGSGNVVNPTFSLTPATLSGWTFRGWSTSYAAAAGITYDSISGTAFAESTTVYAAYYRYLTLSYNGNGATGGSGTTQYGIQYWNTGNVANPTFTLEANGFARSGYAFSTWALGSAGGAQYAAGTSITLSESNTMYAVWTYSGAPFYIVNGAALQGDYATSITWSLLSSDNISYITQWSNGVYAATVRGIKSNTGNNGTMYILSSAINTNGNHTLSIAASRSNGGATITVNGVAKSVSDSTEVLTWDISNVTSIDIYVSCTCWAYSGNCFIEFATIYLY